MSKAMYAALLLTLSAGLVTRAAEGPEALWQAAKTGDAAKVKALVEQGIDVNAKTPQGSTALGLAADNGHLEVLRYLIEQKADVNVSDLLGYTPLGQALANKHVAVVKILLDAGAPAGQNLLWTAARTGDVELVEYILKLPQQPTQTKRPQQTRWRQITQVLQSLGPEQAAVQKLLIKTLLETDGQVETAVTAAAQASNRANSIELLQSVLDQAQPQPEVLAKVLDTLAPQHLVSQKLILEKLLATGGRAIGAAFVSAARRGNAGAVRAILEKAKPEPDLLNQALAATYEDQEEMLKLLTGAGAQGTPKPTVRVDVKTLESYAGKYAYDEDNDDKYQIVLEGGKLVYQYDGKSNYTFKAIDPTTFHAEGNEAKQFTFQVENGKVTALLETANRPGGFAGPPWKYRRVEATATPEPAAVAGASPVVDKPLGRVIAPLNWASFRGPEASGVADGQFPPTQWDAVKGTNIQWKTPIPGLGHASPIVWNNRVFVASAIPSDPNVKVVPGWDDAGSLNDSAKYSWRTYCLDKHTGKILWEQTAHEGLPQAKRHNKATFANSTPATDGQFVVVCFGSEGLFCYDLDGKLVWNQSLGVLDRGWALDSRWKFDYGFASSPIIYRGLVIVQCDMGKSPFLAAYDLKTGSQVWRTARGELPTHAVPAIFQGRERAVLVANSASHIRGYNPLTGEELWSLAYGEGGDAIPTPIMGHELIFVTHGWSAGGPIFAIRPEATGDISLTGTQTENQYIAWSTKREGPYLPTPIVYGDYLYVCSFRGILTCLEAKTGKRVYRERLGGASSYTASPVAADGRLYFAGEDGTVRVVNAGPKFETLAVNQMGEACLATPAISDGMIFVRTLRDLLAIARPESTPPAGEK